MLAQGHKAHEWEGWELGSGSKSVWLQVLTIAPSCLRENVFLFGLMSKRQGWHRAWCSGNKMPQLQKQRLSCAVLWEAVLLVGISGWASLHTFEGPRHSNMVQVVQNLSFQLRCLHAMKTTVFRIARSVLKILDLGFRSCWTSSYWKLSYISLMTAHSEPQVALIAPLTVAFTFQNLWNYIFEGIIHFFP